MKIIRVLLPLLIAAWWVMSMSSCKKETLLNTGGELRFSTDTLTFDTVFTQYASFTIGIKIFNPQNQKIKVSSVRLEKGDNSFFNLNVDGVAGKTVTDINVAANDSFYVFATVNIDPTNENNPFIVEDRLIATLNGNEFSIPVYAYGQNAHYYVNSLIDQNTTWVNDKPYVVIGDAVIDSSVTLTIASGCRIYMNQDARFFAFGNLVAEGTKEDSIIFQGDRLDRAYFGYEGYPGEWGGFYFFPSSVNNRMSWVIIRNCGNSTSGTLPAAIQVTGEPGTLTQLTMNNTLIENSIGYGLLSFTGSIKAQNCLIHTTGAQALAIFQGGNYSFDNCDFLNFGTDKVRHIDANNPTVALLNYFDISETQRYVSNLTANFSNCILYGSLDDEVFCNRDENAGYNVNFNNCILQAKGAIPDYVTIADSKLNEAPMFKDQPKWDYRLQSGSPAIDAGTTVIPITNDLDDKPWAIPFDIGCYQY